MRFLIRFYIAILLVFLAARLAFVAGNTPENIALSFSDYVQMEAHGLLLDTVIAGYLIVVPLLLVFAAIWRKKGMAMRRLLRPYNLVVSVLTAVVCVADDALYPFWKFKLDASVFLYLDSPQNAVASVSAWFVLSKILVGVLLTALIFLFLDRMTPRRLIVSSRRLLRTVVLLLLCVPLAISIRGGVGESTANVGRVYYSETEFCNHAAVNPVFSMLYSLGKTTDFSAQYEFLDEDERAAEFDGLFSTASVNTQKLLTSDRPNILLIILEGFGGAISRRPDIAPNFNKLAKEGVLFTDCYSSSFRTDRGVFATLSGYPAFPDLSVMKMPVKSRTLPCLAQSLNKAGYKSSFLYGGDINFTNMQSYLRTGGYSEITSDKDFTFADSNKSKWGVDDEKTFARLKDIILSKRKRPVPGDFERPVLGDSIAKPSSSPSSSSSLSSPWHIGFLTLSSHEPWEVPYERLENEKANAFAYTDHCLGAFIAWLKQQEEWRQTLVVIIPDHGYQYPETITHQEHHDNQMLWLGGAVKEPLTVDKVMGQTDLCATLLAQLSLSHDDYLFSRDVLSEDYSAHEFAYFTFGGGMGFVDRDGHIVYDLNGNRLLEHKTKKAPSAANQRQKKAPSASRRLKKAKAIIQTLYDDLGSRLR